MTLSDYELRVLREMEAEFTPKRRFRPRGRRGPFDVLLAAACLVLVVLLAVFVGVAVAAPVALGCALVGVAVVLRSRRRWRTGSGR
jgi:Flp pilus assembly protein TadB